MSRKRVLVVDYEPKSLERLLALLPQDLYEVQTAKDGMAALEEFDAFHPDLVLLRTMLPKKHGFQVCQEMVERTGSKPVPVIMHCSIYKSRKYRTDAIKIYGAAEYLEDPVEEGVLQDVLERFLAQKKVEPARPALPPEPSVEPSETPTVRLSAPPLAKPAPEAPVKATLSRSERDVNKALEDTLSGLHVGSSKKRPAVAPEPPKPAPVAPPPRVEPPKPAPAPEPPKPAPAPPPPKPAPVPEPPKPAPAPEPPKPAPAPPPPKPAPESRVTSEELFGDMLREVAPATAPEIPKPEPPKPAPAPAKAPAPVDLGRDLLQPVSGEDTGVKRMTQRSSQELDKKLEETLSGVRLKPKTSAPAPAKPAAEAPQYDLPKIELPKRATPAVEPPEVQLPKIEPPKKPAPAPEPPKPAPVPAAAKVEPPKPAPVPEPPKPAPVSEEAAKEKGVTFGQYLLMDKIAVGGMAELFKAKQTGLEGFQRIVAIKRILPHLAANAEFVTMFIDEAKLAAQLKHPNIVHIYDLGKLEDSYFIAMEYVDGKDLRTILRELDEQGKTLPTRAAIFVAHQVASGLQCAHSAKDVDGHAMHLVHRDVSPQNILLSATGEVKLIDFGIAKAASKASHTQTGALKGKLLYMSPEQAYGRPTDPRTDVFSLAVVMFEMLTGRKLFYGDSEMSILEKVREAKIPDLGEFSDRIPSGLQRILRRALEKDVDKRYADAKAFQVDLEKFARQEWKALPGPYHAVAFLTDIFPEVYKKESVKALAQDESKLEDTGVHELPQGLEKAPETKPAPAPPPKSMRGKPAPLPPKKVEPEKAPEPKPVEKAPEPKPVEKAPPPKPRPEPKAPPVEAPAPKPAPPPPKTAEESAGMFKGVMDEQETKSKKGLYIGGGVAAALVVIVALYFAFSGSKKPPVPPTTPSNPPATGTSTTPGTTPATQPTPPPVLTPVEPVQPPPGAAPASEADLKAARDAAGRAVKALDDAIVAAEQASAQQYAGDALASIKKSKENIDRLFRRAKTKEEYDAAAQTAAQALPLAQQVKEQAAQAKTADERLKATETAAAEEAKRKAEEDARRKADEAAAAAAATPAGTKAGDFVELFAVSVKPKEVQSLKVEYTQQARANRLQGTIYIEVDIDERGAVTSARVVKAPKPDYGMGEALVKASLAMKYTPAIKDGMPVKTRLTFPVRMEMQAPTMGRGGGG